MCKPISFPCEEQRKTEALNTCQHRVTYKEHKSNEYPFTKLGIRTKVAEEYFEDNLKSRSTPDYRTNLEKENERFVKTESKEQIQKDRKSNRPFENKNQSRKFQRAELRSDYTLRKNQIDIHDASQQQAKEIHLVKKAKDPIRSKGSRRKMPKGSEIQIQ